MANLVVDVLPEAKTEDFGFAKGIEARIGGIHSLRSDDHNSLVLLYDIEFSNGMPLKRSQPFHAQELPKLALEMFRQIHNEAQAHVENWFAKQYGGGELDPQKWTAKKTEVFISYRGPVRDFAMKLYRALGEYENRTVFIPRIDRVDLNAGDWLDQLAGLIEQCPVFIPILTQDYLEGPVAREELHTVLRQSYRKTSTKRIVPVLVEGDPHDYDYDFIGNQNMIQAQNDYLDGDFSPETIGQIARFALGVSEGDYE